MTLFYDRENKPINGTQKWALMYEDAEYRRVAHDVVGDTTVSTIWTGFDPSMGDPPNIFETAVFKEGSWQESERWPTETSALAAHRNIVELLRFVHDNQLPEGFNLGDEGTPD